MIDLVYEYGSDDVATSDINDYDTPSNQYNQQQHGPIYLWPGCSASYKYVPV